MQSVLFLVSIYAFNLVINKRFLMMKQNEAKGQRPVKGFLAFLKNEVERQCENGHLSVANNYASAGNSFRRFLDSKGMKDLSFKKLTSLIVSDYEAWLQSNGLCKNTCSFYVRALQSVYNKAARQQLTVDQQPFRHAYRGVAKTVKRAITPEDIYRLCVLDIHQKLIAQGYKADSCRLAGHQRPLEFARDLFVFSFCARGLTFVDLAFMRKSDIVGGIMTYVRRKTKQRMEVRVEPLMQTIIDRYPSDTAYLFPILTNTDDHRKVYQRYRYAITRYNHCLRQLGEMMGNLKLTSYVARHSWATTAHRQNVPLPVISQSMGHDSVKTTEIYLKSLEGNVIHQMNHKLINQVFRMDKHL